MFCRLWPLVLTIFEERNYSDFGALRRHVKQLPPSRILNAWGQTGWCQSSHGIAFWGESFNACSLKMWSPFSGIRVGSTLNWYINLRLFLYSLKLKLKVSTNRPCTVEELKLSVVKKSKLHRNGCWRVRLRTLRRDSECVSGTKDWHCYPYWHY